MKNKSTTSINVRIWRNNKTISYSTRLQKTGYSKKKQKKNKKKKQKNKKKTGYS